MPGKPGKRGPRVSIFHTVTLFLFTFAQVLFFPSTLFNPPPKSYIHVRTTLLNDALIMSDVRGECTASSALIQKTSERFDQALGDIFGLWSIIQPDVSLLWLWVYSSCASTLPMTVC